MTDEVALTKKTLPPPSPTHHNMADEAAALSKKNTLLDGTGVTRYEGQGLPVLANELYRDAALGHIIYGPSKHDGTCWLCNKDERREALFQPCPCPVVCHRDCFRQWRAGWINPRNYFSCPSCMHRYNIERVAGRSSSTLSKEQIVRNYRLKVVQLWLAVLFIVAGLSGAIALIAYGSDTANKNIPVAVKFMLTSVIHGWPQPNAAAEWRQDFRSADTPVWQYYALLGWLVTSILVLIAFAFVGCTFDENDRSSRNCCESIGCNDNGTCMWCWCYDPCPPTRYGYGSGGGYSGGSGSCNCSGCNCNGCGDCGDCKCSGGGGGNGGGEVLIVLLLVVIVIVLVSAIFVIIGYALRKWALFQDRMTDMLKWQQEELEGETVVLGMDENVRPLNEV